MAHSKKKAAILTVATSLLITAAEVFASQRYIEAAILIGIAAVLFGLYERFNFKEIPFDQQQLEDFAEEGAEEVNDRIDSK